MGIAQQRVVFEGRRTTVRTVAMLREARRLFTARTGRRPPAISQGGYNGGGVSASAGTHDRDALDFRTAGWPASVQRAWERALRDVGFAAWWRPYRWNVWPEHCHAIPKGGDVSRGAANQVRAFRAKRDGLVSNAYDSTIGTLATKTWEQYLSTRKKVAAKKVRTLTISGRKYRDIPYVSLHWLLRARRGKGLSRHVWYVQRWLSKLNLYNDRQDGKWGPRTQAAYDRFRRSLGWSASKCVGAPGWASLRLLSKKARSTKPLKQGA